jgi:hypothetical protein
MRSRRSLLPALIPALLLAGCADLLGSIGGGDRALSLDTIVAGLKEALRVGTGNAVRSTSKADGYWANAAIRIPMPPELQKFGSALRGLGLGQSVDSFEKRMNQAAEQAAVEAAPVFLDAIKQMTFDDARRILKGQATEATDYFRGKTTDPLKAKYRPMVRAQMEKVGAVREYNALMERYRKIPLAPKPKFDLDEYVTAKALDGLFLVLGQEERRIRENPAARTTELLRTVFGAR